MGIFNTKTPISMPYATYGHKDITKIHIYQEALVSFLQPSLDKRLDVKIVSVRASSLGVSKN